MIHTTTQAIVDQYMKEADVCMVGEVNRFYTYTKSAIKCQAERGLPWAYIEVPDDVEADELYMALGAIAGSGFRVQRMDFTKWPIFKISW